MSPSNARVSSLPFPTRPGIVSTTFRNPTASVTTSVNVYLCSRPVRKVGTRHLLCTCVTIVEQQRPCSDYGGYRIAKLKTVNNVKVLVTRNRRYYLYYLAGYCATRKYDSFHFFRYLRACACGRNRVHRTTCIRGNSIGRKRTWPRCSLTVVSRSCTVLRAYLTSGYARHVPMKKITSTRKTVLKAIFFLDIEISYILRPVVVTRPSEVTILLYVY